MKLRALFLIVSLMSVSLVASAQKMASGSAEKMQQEIRHELNMLPYLTTFDYIAYRVNGRNVTLVGEVTKPALKSDAENVVKHVEGVEQVDNQIEVLPPSSQDDRLRIRLFHAIYGSSQLQKYELGTTKPIRILVKAGKVTLAGVVDNQSDKNVAGIRANSVPGIFSVDNQLQVVSGK